MWGQVHGHWASVSLSGGYTNTHTPQATTDITFYFSLHLSHQKKWTHLYHHLPWSKESALRVCWSGCVSTLSRRRWRVQNVHTHAQDIFLILHVCSKMRVNPVCLFVWVQHKPCSVTSCVTHSSLMVPLENMWPRLLKKNNIFSKKAGGKTWLKLFGQCQAMSAVVNQLQYSLPIFRDLPLRKH